MSISVDPVAFAAGWKIYSSHYEETADLRKRRVCNLKQNLRTEPSNKLSKDEDDLKSISQIRASINEIMRRRSLIDTNKNIRIFKVLEKRNVYKTTFDRIQSLGDKQQILNCVRKDM